MHDPIVGRQLTWNTLSAEQRTYAASQFQLGNAPDYIYKVGTNGSIISRRHIHHPHRPRSYDELLAMWNRVANWRQHQILRSGHYIVRAELPIVTDPHVRTLYRQLATRAAHRAITLTEIQDVIAAYLHAATPHR